MKRSTIARLYLVMMVVCLLTMVFACVTVMAEESVNWNSNTQNGELQAPDGIGSGTGDWGSPTYTAPESTANTDGSSSSGSNATALAILAGIAGVLGITAATGAALTKKDVTSIIPDGNGIWVPEADRSKVLEMINNAASKQYYIDENGFVKEVAGGTIDASKSATYSKLLDDLIAGDKKVIIGVDSGWNSYNPDNDQIKSNSLSSNDGGVTIGDNGTDQVVVVSEQDTKNGSAEMTLAHELVHALRGEYQLKNEDPDGGVNKDEEAHAIQIENTIRYELGLNLRTDGDPSDDVNNDGVPDGDGTYGKYNITGLDRQWFVNLEDGGKALSGSVYNHSSSGCSSTSTSTTSTSTTSTSTSTCSSTSTTPTNFENWTAADWAAWAESNSDANVYYQNGNEVLTYTTVDGNIMTETHIGTYSSDTMLQGMDKFVSWLDYLTEGKVPGLAEYGLIGGQDHPLAPGDKVITNYDEKNGKATITVYSKDIEGTEYVKDRYVESLSPFDGPGS